MLTLGWSIELSGKLSRSAMPFFKHMEDAVAILKGTGMENVNTIQGVENGMKHNPQLLLQLFKQSRAPVDSRASKHIEAIIYKLR